MRFTSYQDGKPTKIAPRKLALSVRFSKLNPYSAILRYKSGFEKALGFAVQVQDVVMTSRDAVELFLSLKSDHDPKRTAFCVYIRVDDADALHARWEEAGIVDLRELRNTDIGCENSR
jgi:hypothetical protein